MEDFDKTLLFLRQKWPNVKAIPLNYPAFDSKLRRTQTFEVNISLFDKNLIFCVLNFPLKWGKTGPMFGYFWDSVRFYPVVYRSKKDKWGTHIWTRANRIILFRKTKYNRKSEPNAEIHYLQTQKWTTLLQDNIISNFINNLEI